MIFFSIWLNISVFSLLDGEENAVNEIKFFFPEFSCDDWYKLDEEKFRRGEFQLDKRNFVHKLLWLSIS